MVTILDFGSQYTQLIARRLRELKVYSEIVRFDIPLQKLVEMKPEAIILSGGPNSVYEVGAPQRNIRELSELAPLLGLCYGMQLISQSYGGTVKKKTEGGEYGLTQIIWDQAISNVPFEQSVWMSHGDSVDEVPKNFRVVARSQKGIPAAIQSDRIWAFQFHPEVTHTEHGEDLLRAFLFDFCKIKPTWDPRNIIDHISTNILTQIPDNEDVICALSGGVDSTVVGVLLTKILGAKRVNCVFVDNGLLRKNEFEDVMSSYTTLGLNVVGLREEKRFLNQLKGVSDPEQKRKIIGHAFIEVFDEHIHHLDHVKWLAQGTLYPDVIESLSPRGPSVTIKTHHNVGGLPEKLKLKLVEPLRELFKDEVRQIGKALEIPVEMLMRHPFPGPGLGIRLVGEVTKQDLDILREADAIYVEELKANGLYNQIWQAGAVLLPVRTVGVQGDSRSYEKTVALRAVVSKDAMTADWFPFRPEFLKKVSSRITNEVRKINRVVYDITSKPPGTIEWE